MRSVTAHGSASTKPAPAILSTSTWEDGVPVAFEPKFALQDISDVRARTVDLTFRIAEAGSIASAGLPLAAMPRKYVPRNTPPEPE